MTKRDLVLQIIEETDMARQDVTFLVQRTLDLISAAVAKGKTVEIRNFGVFEVKVSKARIGRNPNRPEIDVPIPQRAIVKFKPGKEMREAVLKLSPSHRSKKKGV
jgi:nucleoid DNA-binding protein